MRIAVFTSQFPGRTASFFARDIRGLLEAGADIEVFPIYDLDPRLWRYIPDMLNERVLPRAKIHHVSLLQSLQTLKLLPFKTVGRFLKETLSMIGSAAKYGLEPVAKTSYVSLKAWAFARLYPNTYDHVLAYWGNYPATCAYLYHHLSGQKNPFSIFLHANADLYRVPVALKRKITYADRIITCSEFNTRYISDSFSDIDRSINEKLFVHHHGIDFASLPSCRNDGASNIVIAVGRFVKQKGFEYLLRAVHLLASRGVNITVELVGDGDQFQLLRRLACDLNIADQVRFRGWLPADEVPAAIAKATILVHPSPDLGDGVPNVIKEAMAVGTPVVGSQVAGIPELLAYGHNGLLVPPKNVTALADAVSTLLTNRALRLQFSQEARRYAENKFDLWKNGRRLADCLNATRRVTEK
jgi:glycosyltransferase involved in cell wall biosynthesis